MFSHVGLLQNPKPFPHVPLLFLPIRSLFMFLLMFKQDKDLTPLLFLVLLLVDACFDLVEFLLHDSFRQSFLSFSVVCGHMHKECWRHSLLKYNFMQQNFPSFVKNHTNSKCFVVANVGAFCNFMFMIKIIIMW